MLSKHNRCQRHKGHDGAHVWAVADEVKAKPSLPGELREQLQSQEFIRLAANPHLHDDIVRLIEQRVHNAVQQEAELQIAHANKRVEAEAAFIEQREAIARDKALEEAAQVCDEYAAEQNKGGMETLSAITEDECRSMQEAAETLAERIRLFITPETKGAA
jgi:hypothetical protein